MTTSDLTYETKYFWEIARELHDAKARDDQETARLAAEEIEAIALHAESPLVRQRCATLLAEAA